MNGDSGIVVTLVERLTTRVQPSALRMPRVIVLTYSRPSYPIAPDPRHANLHAMMLLYSIEQQ
jgi:hypothetical protein